MTPPPGDGPPGGPAPPPGYGYPGYGYAPPDHPQATTALVLGIVGLVVCAVVAPFAWAMGRRTVSEIDSSQGRLGGRGQAQAGYVLGMIGTVILGTGVLFLALYFLVVVVMIGGSILSG